MSPTEGSGGMTDQLPVRTPLPARVECPRELLPNGATLCSFDTGMLRFAAERHNEHPMDHSMEIKAWVVLWLLDRAEEAQESSGSRRLPLLRTEVD